jgi:hypothetical protein
MYLESSYADLISLQIVMPRQTLNPNERIKSQLTGKGFELSVASELLLRGMVCHLALVDAGVDLLSWNFARRLIRIQVKGRNFLGHGTEVETVVLSSRSVNDPTTVFDFLIIPMRYLKCDQLNAAYGSISHIVLPHATFEQLRHEDWVSTSERTMRLNLNVEFSNSSGKAIRVILQKRYGRRQAGRDLTQFLNAWNLIVRSKRLHS